MNKNVVFYLGSILVANLLVKYFGIVIVFGLSFPAGAVMVGLSFSFRDMVQRSYGKKSCWLFMILATIITVMFSINIAVASGLAFFISELIDWFIFTYLKTSYRKRVMFSNVISTPIDSLIFVPLVFGWVWPAIIGQAVIKIISSFIILPFINNDNI